MNGTTLLNTPRMIYHWKEERKGYLECHLRIAVSLRRPELWDGFANRPQFSEINAQLFVSRVRVRSGNSFDDRMLSHDRWLWFFFWGAYGSLPDAAIWWCLRTGGGGVLTRSEKVSTHSRSLFNESLLKAGSPSQVKLAASEFLLFLTFFAILHR